MKLMNIKAAYGLCQSLYGINPDEDSFEELALEAWGRIGNKHTRLYRYVADTKNQKLELPCNVDEIESVHIPFPDAQTTSNLESGLWTDNIWIEGWIDAWKRTEDPYWTRGKLVKYDSGNNELFFSRDYPKVMVVYHGIFADEEDGLPLVNEKELRAIATYIAYVELNKEAIKKRDINLMKMAKTIEESYNKLAAAARVKEYLNQNDMDRILDVKARWDRKKYGVSYKAIL